MLGSGEYYGGGGLGEVGVITVPAQLVPQVPDVEVVEDRQMLLRQVEQHLASGGGTRERVFGGSGQASAVAGRGWAGAGAWRSHLRAGCV